MRLYGWHGEKSKVNVPDILARSLADWRIAITLHTHMATGAPYATLPIICQPQSVAIRVADFLFFGHVLITRD